MMDLRESWLMVSPKDPMSAMRAPWPGNPIRRLHVPMSADGAGSKTMRPAD